MSVAREDGIIFLPDSFLRAHGIDPRKVAPSWLAPKRIILDGLEGIGDVSQIAGGRAGHPGELTLIDRKDGRMPLMIVHDADTEAAEIEDLAYEAMERKPIDFAEARERRGWPAASEFSNLLKQAAEDAVRRAKANSVTGRRRDPMQQFVRGLVTVPAMPSLTADEASK